MRPYPAYKDSGVEWLGEVPEGWEVVPLRRVVSLNPSKTETAELDRLQEVSFIPMEAVGENGELELSRSRPIGEVESGYTYFRDGDMTFAKITPCFENGKRALMRGLLGGVGFGTTELTVLRAIPSRVSQEFLFWLLSSPDFRNSGEAHMYGAGGQKRVPDDFVREFHSPLPPLPEQQAIARFLDKEVAKIDALVAEQRRLITLLAEKRQAVISHAVTKGLNPATPVKPSGIDWLGDIPDGWEVKELKHLIADGTTITYGIVQAGPEYEGGIPYIRTSDMAGSKLPVSGYPLTSPEIEAAYERSRVFPGDIVVAIRATIGKALPVPDELLLANLTQGTAKISPGRDCLRDYLLFALAGSGAQTYFDLMAKGATFREITLDALRRLPLPIPPVLEQGTIAAFLRTQTTQLDALTDAATSAISLLQERRAALISAAVTGKIDLRAHFAQSLSEPETA